MTPRRLFAFPWRSRRRIADDVEQELAFHLHSRVQELTSLGMSLGDAEVQARREFGDLEDARAYMVRVDREIEDTQRRREHVRDLLRDMRYALRRMRKAPAFTLTAVATLALGIGANTAVFSVVEAALLRPLPYPNADRVVAAYTLAPFGPFSTSAPDFFDWRDQTRSFEAMAALATSAQTLTGLGEPVSIPTGFVTQDFFRVLGVAPTLGRVFGPAEMSFGADKYAVLSHGFWQRAMGSSPDVVGKTLELDGDHYVITGVMPPGFAYPSQIELWVPITFDPATLQSQRGAHYLDVLGLLRPGVTVADARADLAGVASRLAEQYPNTNRDYSADLDPLRDSLVGETPKRALLVLLGAVGLVALIACVNVANLVLARGTSRARELAVRVALGASPRDLLYMALTESILLALIGGLLGLLVAWGLAGTLDALRPQGLRDMGALEINMTAAGFTLLLSLLAGVLFGLAPGLQAARRTSLERALRAGGRAETSERQGNRVRGGLMAAELALAVILLSGAALLIKSFARLQQVDAGFDPTNVLTFRVSLPDSRYADDARTTLAIEEILDRTRRIGGVVEAGAMNFLPQGPGSYSISTSVLDGVRIESADQPSTQIRVVAHGTLRMLGVSLKAGREFEPTDRLGAAPVVIVNESAARLLWPGVNPVGHSIRIGTRFTSDTARAGGTVVGVVADIKDRSPGTAARPTVYFPHGQAPWSSMSIVLRVRDDVNPLSLVDAIKPQIAAVDPLLPVVRPRTMEDIVATAVAQPRFATLLMSVFAALAVVLAVIGVFGVMAYIVGQRTREIGIRMALGASQRRVVVETLRRTFAPLAIGIGLGIVGTLWLVRWLSSMLYDVAPRDPTVLGAVAIGLVGVALLAAYVPARRASAVDPLSAVRAD